jgi:hypothetical protein
MTKMSKKRYQTMMRRLRILRSPMYGARDDEKTIAVLPSIQGESPLQATQIRRMNLSI